MAAQPRGAGGVDLIPAPGVGVSADAGEITTIVVLPQGGGPRWRLPTGASPGLLTSLQLCVTVGYGVCRNS